MALSTRSGRFAPWAAFAGAILGEALHHQVLSDMLRFRCELGGPAAGVTGAAVAWALMGIGAWISWTSVRGKDDHPHRHTRLFIARVGWMMCALFSVAVLWQMLAMWVLPPCP